MFNQTSQHPRLCRSQPLFYDNRSYKINGNVDLCPSCQANQIKKLKLLSAYDPPQSTISTDFDNNAQNYKLLVDNKYPLCDNCQQRNIVEKLPKINVKFS